MATTENRYIRIEDWKGNTYFPESNSGSTTAGEVIGGSGAGTSPEDPTYTQGTVISDPAANGGSAISLSSSTERQTLFRTYFSDAKFGNITLNARMKASVATGTTKLIEINTYFVDASGETPVETHLDKIEFTGNDFKVANEYINLGFVTDYKGTATGSSLLKVEVIVLPDTGATFCLDFLAMSMGMRSSSSLNVHVEGTTVVFD